jgi:hypothetical protein
MPGTSTFFLLFVVAACLVPLFLLPCVAAWRAESRKNRTTRLIFFGTCLTALVAFELTFLVRLLFFPSSM